MSHEIQERTVPSSREKPNKAKIARRVIEVLDFFDDENREASVMDIVRRYGRPQSSTSELLASLVELGLLGSTLATNPAVRNDLRYDTQRDLSAILYFSTAQQGP